jgi:hypothetical protein
MSLRHLLATAAALGGAAVATGCGGSTVSNTAATSPTGGAAASGGGGSVSFTGDVTGTWSKAGEAKESTCGATEAVIHVAGPASGDEGNVHVTADGSVWLDAEKYGDFKSTTGGTLQASKGLQVNADIATERGKKAHISGTLSC